MLLGYLKGEIEPPKQETIEEARAFEQQGYECLEMAIKALETVSCIKEKCAYCPHCENCDVDDETLEIKALEQQPCEDAISREKAKQFLYERINRLNDDELYDIFSKIIDDMYNELPSVTPEPPEDDDRKCMRCKHCIERGPGWANPYGCDAWTCEFEKKEEDEEWEN